MDALCHITKKVMDAFSFNQKKRKPSESDNPPLEPMPQKKQKTSEAAQVDDYQVFLSFRGPDTRYDFTDVLYDHMDRVGICVFKDDDEIPVGEPIDTILQAIETSEICVPIFSRSFASSAWCLREVEKMIDLEKDVMPIFYRVSPEDVKLKTNLYEDAMVEHEATYGKERVKKWKDALKKTAKIKGMEISANTGYTEFCKKFVSEVLRKLKPRKGQNDSSHLVGMESQFESVIKLLDTESNDVPYIKIHGMGGIGKTTLARVIFNDLSARFECSCFLENVRESSLEELQKKLQEGLLSRSWRRSNFCRDVVEMYQRMKVLIVLDDVDKPKQVEQLTGKSCWFGFGSRIIVTTRNANVLEGYGALHQSFEMKTLNHCQALELFKWHAFRKDTPPPFFETLSRKVLSAVGGLPLAIEVIGSHLYNKKDENVWRQVIARSKKMQDRDLKERLKISYDALEHDCKQMFLDIACLPITVEKEKLFYMWEASGFYPDWGFAVLNSLSLVKTLDNVKIKMHDQLRDLGKNIVREENIEDPKKRSRLWDEEEAQEVLLSKEGKEKVEVLCITKPFKKVYLTGENFASFERLRYLELAGADIKGDCRSFLPKLTWLSWHLCPSNFNTTILHMKNLVNLDFSHSFMDENWDGWSAIQELRNLKVLDLSHCLNLTSTPLFSEINALKRIVLRGCKRLGNIHGSIVQLKGLEHLHLDHCYSLQGLPDEIGLLEDLKEIVVTGSWGSSGCTFNLPNSIGNLRSLEVLTLHGLEISELPDSIGHLESLVKLDLSKTRVNELPSSIGRLIKLKSLNLYECSNLKELPDTLGDLKSLTELNFAWTKVSILPDSIGCLQELKSLESSKIKKLPRSIGMLMKLEKIGGNTPIDSLEEIPVEIEGLSSLKRLRICFSSISTVPSSIKQLTHLQKLHLTKVDKLQELPELPSSLMDLWISGRSLRRVADLSKLTNLTTLHLVDTDHFTWPGQLQHSNLAGIDKLTKLHWLELSLSNISTLPFDLGSLTQLKTLGLYFPKDLDCINVLPSASSESVSSRVSAMTRMKLPNLCNLKLRTIQFYDFSTREGLDGLGVRELLTSQVSQQVRIDNCVIELIELCLLKTLKHLSIYTCRFLQKLPDLSQLKDLEMLSVTLCEELVDIPGLGNLESLAVLHIQYCDSLERLENLSKLEELSRMLLTDCPKLRSIEGTDRLCFSSLTIDNCKSLENVDELKKRAKEGDINGLRFENLI